jgi:hypothetical protein
MIDNGIVNFIGLKGFRVQWGAVDYLYNIRVCLYKEVYKNFTEVLGFSHFGVINVAYLNGLWHWEKTKDCSRTVVGYGV